jgi:HTH-like domain
LADVAAEDLAVVIVVVAALAGEAEFAGRCRPSAVPVAVTCRVLGISRQAYYQWCAAPVCQRDRDDAHLINAALEIHADDPADGYRFIAGELARRGFTASENRVWRICSMQQISPCTPRRKTVPARPGRRCTTISCAATSPPTHRT